MDALAQIKSLQVIKLDYTGVDDAGVEALHSLPLRELSFDNDGVTDKSMAVLKTISTLKNLNIYHTLVTEKGMQEVKTALPACAIVACSNRDSALPTRRLRKE